MNTEELIAEWKREHGEIFVAQVDEYEFIYRLLGFKEYDSMERRAYDTVELDEMICRTCILDPYIEDWQDDIYAGYSSTLGELIREESLITPKADGSSDVKLIINNKLDELSGKFLLQMPLVIKRSFPEYTLKELESMNLKEQTSLYAKSIWMLKQFEGIEMQFSEED